MAERFAIAAGHVLPMNAAPISEGAVIVSGDRIEAVIPRGELPSGLPCGEHPEGILMPAFVNAHTHLALTSYRGMADDADFFTWLTKFMIPLGMELDERTCRESARAGVRQCFRHGITALGDCHFLPWGREAMLESGMKGVTFFEVFGVRVLDLARSVARQREEIEKLAKEATDGVRVGVSPHAPYSVSPPMGRMAGEVAAKLDLPISIHVAETRDEVELFLHGRGRFAVIRTFVRLPIPDGSGTPLRYLDELGLLTPRTLLVHGIHLSDSDLDIIAARGCTLVTCPTSNAKLAAGVARVGAWLRRGIPTCIATDSPASGEGYDLFEEMRRFILLQRGLTCEIGDLSAEQVLHMVTTTPARALGMAEMVGDLRAGSCADLVLVEPSRDQLSENRDVYGTLVWGTRAQDIVAVWADGKEVYRR